MSANQFGDFKAEIKKKLRKLPTSYHKGKNYIYLKSMSNMDIRKLEEDMNNGRANCILRSRERLEFQDVVDIIKNSNIEIDIYN